jgi:uncharacterized protein YggE
MRTSYLIALTLASASLLFGQLDSDTVTIQASRSVNLTPDQVVFAVSVSAGPTTSLDQIVAALASSGITATNFVGVTGGADNQSPLQWLFTLAAPLTKIKATIALTVLQQSIAHNNSGLTLMFQVQRTQFSPESIQSQSCAAKDLVAGAQTQAQNVAAAAGLYVGPIVAISDGSSAMPTFAARVGDFLIGNWINPTGLWYNPTPPGCSVEVKFKLLRYQ